MSQKHKGSCLCQKVRFEVEGEFENFFLCHCKHCQKDTGSAHAANLFSTTSHLNWLCGKEQVTSYTMPNTKHSKSFCSNCGSAVPSLQMQGKLLVVPAGCLDSKIENKPKAHIFIKSRAEWDNDLEKLKKFEALPK